MGHPDRKTLRERRKKARREEMLGRRNFLHVLDLTPHNALGVLKNSAEHTLKYK